MAESVSKTRIEYIKSPSFRVVHADGVFGGLTPAGRILLSAYNERFPIPTAVVHELDQDGRLGAEIRAEREGRKAVVREVDVGIEMDLTVAKATLEWLSQKIELLEAKIKES